MILGIDVAFIHTPYRALADWYADVLIGPSLVATFVDPDGNCMQLSQRKAVGEGQ